ncbi:hypothetical protein [Cyanobium sp. ATX-6F1]|uniref:hypothetical protein n=1 Tax=Cyanobium sp. ATX-6F1 TaxID=3137388 RepID=UPI0039BDD85C
MVGAVAVLLVLGPWLGADPLMACLIEVGFEGGHGSAAVMGPIYADLGFAGGTDLGLAMATVGLLSSTVVGGLLVVLAQGQGWLLAAEAGAPLCVLPEPTAAAVAAGPSWAERLRQLATNLALVGIAVGIGVVLLAGLERLAEPTGGVLRTVIDALPVYPLALAGLAAGALGAGTQRPGRAGHAGPAERPGRPGHRPADCGGHRRAQPAAAAGQLAAAAGAQRFWAGLEPAGDPGAGAADPAGGLV